MRGYPQFSSFLWISITLVQICFSRILSEPKANQRGSSSSLIGRTHFSSKHKGLRSKELENVVMREWRNQDGQKWSLLCFSFFRQSCSQGPRSPSRPPVKGTWPLGTKLFFIQYTLPRNHTTKSKFENAKNLECCRKQIF